MRSFALAVAALAAVALTPAASAQLAPSGINAPGGLGVQGVYYASAPSPTATQTVNVAISPYTHVNIIGGALSMSLSPGGTGVNKTTVNGQFRYATNYADRSLDVQVNEAPVPGTTEDFDEIRFIVRPQNNATPSTAEDIGDDGSLGTFTNYLQWEGGSETSGDTKRFIDNFGEVVAIADVKYEIVASDVALEGARTFDVVYTIVP